MARDVGFPKVPLWIHFDIDAEVNVIDQSFALANNLESIEAPLPVPSGWMGILHSAIPPILSTMSCKTVGATQSNADMFSTPLQSMTIPQWCSACQR